MMTIITVWYTGRSLTLQKTTCMWLQPALKQSILSSGSVGRPVSQAGCG